MPKVEIVPVGEFAMNCYLVQSQDSRELFVVDPGAEGDQIIRAIGERKPVAVLLTHGHFDHIGGVDEVCEHFQIPVYMHELDIPKLRDPALNEGAAFGARVTVRAQPVALRDGDTLTLAGMKVRVLHTPGHSKGSCCYLLGEECVFCGDTLFDGGYGRYDFADGDFTELKHSLRQLFLLTPKRIAYPGHGVSTCAGRDREEEQP